jgi:hypothetical protein
MNTQMRKDALRRYLVFRVKVIEMLDIGVVRQTAAAGDLSVPNPVGRLPKDFADSLRTPLLSWFALLIDKNGTDAIKLWSELFPNHRTQISETWARIKPAWGIIRRFRDKAGFHADNPRAFFGARRDVLANHKKLAAALEDFRRLFSTILHAETTELPDFPQVVDEFLDEMEAEHHSRYNRTEFRRYLMIRTDDAHASDSSGFVRAL